MMMVVVVAAKHTFLQQNNELYTIIDATRAYRHALSVMTHT
jgi:hypothetical protein